MCVEGRDSTTILAPVVLKLLPTLPETQMVQFKLYLAKHCKRRHICLNLPELFIPASPNLKETRNTSGPYGVYSVQRLRHELCVFCIKIHTMVVIR